VAKEVRSSMGQGVFFIDSYAAWREYAQANTVWYAQEYLAIERDLRVVVIGQNVVCAYWREQPAGGFHTNIAQGGQLRFDAIPKAALELVSRVATELAIDHAGFDVAMVNGYPYLLEFNLYFGTQGVSAQGVQVTNLIYQYLYSHPDTPTPPQGMPPDHLQVA
jgi:ribosomal protein S6--L-glutamate ligase